MRIGVDATSWFNGRGYGRYTRELLPPLVAAGASHEWVLYVERQNADRLGLSGANVRVRPVECSVAPSVAASAEGSRSPRDLLRFSSAASGDRNDAFFFPTVYGFFPLLRARGLTVTIHDAIAERFPQHTLPTFRARVFWNAKVRVAVRQARIVLTVSEHAAGDLARFLRIPPSRIRVSGEAPAAVYARDSSPDEVRAAARAAGLPEGARWFTYVGGFSPHKRLDVLLRAHARLVAAGGAAPYLVLVGSTKGDVFLGCRERLLALIEELGTGSRVLWPGFVPDESLRALHAGALACVLPSECEGFGLPAVEAAAAGAAVVATTESPLPQVLEGGGVFVAPGGVDTLADALAQVASDDARRAAWAARARDRARALSWPRAAQAALAAIEEAAA